MQILELGIVQLLYLVSMMKVVDFAIIRNVVKIFWSKWSKCA